MLSTCTLACSPASQGTRGTTIPLGPAAAFTIAPVTQIVVRQSPKRPTVTAILRDGDPMPAIAAVVLVDGASIGATSLSGIVEARLHASGWPSVESIATQDGYRVQVLVETPQRASEFVSAFREALARPIGVGTPELKHAAERLNILKRRPVDAPALVPIFQCTGELGATRADAWPDLNSPAAVEELEKKRRASHAVPRLALSVAGPVAFMAAIVHAVEAKPWDLGTLPDDPWPPHDSIGVFQVTDAAQVQPRLFIAARVGNPFAATLVAERAAEQNSSLIDRWSEALPWKVLRVSSSARPRGACLSVTLQRDKSRQALPLEVDAARIAAFITHDVQAELADVQIDGSEAIRQVLRASDPRVAASLGAWWAMASQLPPGPDRVALALGMSPARVGPSDPQVKLDERMRQVQRDLSSNYMRARSAWQRRVIEARTTIENGQGEVWVLWASPCGTTTDTDHDAGITALAAIAAAHARNGQDGVTIEPYVGQDGVGVLAHAAARPGENPFAVASRIADAGGHAMHLSNIPASALTTAKNAVLAHLERPSGPLGLGFGALALELAPVHPAWLSPLGLHESVLKANSEMVSLRWRALANGPLRVAVIANANASQAEAALQSADRWVVRGSTQPRQCPATALGASRAAKSTTLHSPSVAPHAWLGVSIPSPDESASTMAELFVEALGGEDGWLSSTTAREATVAIKTSVRWVSGSRMGAVVIEVEASEVQLEESIKKIQALFQTLQQNGASSSDFARAKAIVVKNDTYAHLDPRRRIADLWRGIPESRPRLDLASWNAWMKRVLSESAPTVVRMLPGESSGGT